MKISMTTRKHIYRMWDEGMSAGKIAQALALPKGAAANLIHKHGRKSGLVTRRGRILLLDPAVTSQIRDLWGAGYKPKQIAEMTGAPVNSVTKALNYGHKRGLLTRSHAPAQTPLADRASFW